MTISFKQKHFEELIAAAGLVYDAVKRSSSLNNNIEVKKKMEILDRILEELKFLRLFTQY